MGSEDSEGQRWTGDEGGGRTGRGNGGRRRDKKKVGKGTRASRIPVGSESLNERKGCRTRQGDEGDCYEYVGMMVERRRWSSHR